MTDVTFVPGIPGPQGSKRYAGHRRGRPVLVESSAKVQPWRDAVTAEMLRQVGNRAIIPAGVPVRVEIEFVLPRPKRTPASRPTPPAVKRPDLDKVVRSTFDALSGTRFADDAQVVELATRKRLAEVDEPTGAWISVQEVTDGGNE